jgi:hypothetical protein
MLILVLIGVILCCVVAGGIGYLMYDGAKIYC